MKRLEDLQHFATQSMAGLQADAALKNQILARAAQLSAQPKISARSIALRPVLAFSAALVVAVLLAVPTLFPKESLPTIVSQPAGSLLTTPGNAQGTLTAGSLRLHSGRATVNAVLWEKSENGSFPLLMVGGRTYRMMTPQEDISPAILSGSIGTVAEFTNEPALSSSNGLLSNVVPAGTAVYPVSGMEDTLLTAQVDGQTRLFQRVGFNGKARQGKESFGDTLQIDGHITGMSLTGVGSLFNREDCEALFSLLDATASYESSSSLSSSQALLITLDNGLAVQLLVKNDKLAACGTWSCPEFFEAFQQKAEK